MSSYDSQKKLKNRDFFKADTNSTLWKFILYLLKGDLKHCMKPSRLDSIWSLNLLFKWSRIILAISFSSLGEWFRDTKDLKRYFHFTELLIFHVYFENVTPIYYSILQNLSTLLMSRDMLKHPTSKVGVSLEFCCKWGSLMSVFSWRRGTPREWAWGRSSISGEHMSNKTSPYINNFLFISQLSFYIFASFSFCRK